MSRFDLLLEALERSVATDYAEARAHVVQPDIQRAGHEGEATWQRLLSQWGPGWPVVTRKYVVGPGGDSNEVDVLVLKPDYPAHLHQESSILFSGVAAAFSCKLTLRRRDIIEALDQKRRLLTVAGNPQSNVRHALCGPFPFGLLAHSSDLPDNAAGFVESTRVLYDALAHSSVPRRVTQPSEELDAVLVADQAFFSTMRVAWLPASGDQPAGPASSFSGPTGPVFPGSALTRFVTWLNDQTGEQGRGSLSGLSAMYRTNEGSGYMTRWSMDIYPEHLRTNPSALMAPPSGGPAVFF